MLVINGSLSYFFGTETFSYDLIQVIHVHDFIFVKIDDDSPQW